MKRIFRTVLRGKPVILTLFFGAVFLSRHAMADDTVPYKSISPLVESTTERTAIVAVRSIAEARSDIHRKAMARAGRDLDDAMRLMETIRDDLTTSPARNLIRIARKHLEIEPAGQVVHDLTPIYDSLDTISVYLPTDRAKAHLDRAKTDLEQGDKRGADRELALADTSLIINEVELPLLKAERYVALARGFLAAGEPGKADKALQAAERRAMALYTGIRSPLCLACQNIWLAYRNTTAARTGAAGTYLAQARTYLEKAASGGSATGKAEAGKLSREIGELEKKQGERSPIAGQALKGAWEKSVALAERATAYLSSDLSEEETIVKGEDSLIEARLHVAYAETYQVTTAEPAKAGQELDRALSYLQKAVGSKLADPADREKIEKIEAVLRSLKATSEQNSAGVRERYDAVKEELKDIKTQEELSVLSQKVR
jgi:YfdX protein